MRKLKHLSLELWPEADHEAFRGAYKPGDIFDESCGPGAHHSQGWRRMVRTSYRRWLGFLFEYYRADLSKPPATRITPERVQAFVEQLSTEVRPTTVAISVANLYAAARLIAPMTDWRWLASVKARLAAHAEPEGRFNLLVPPWHTLDFGLELMDDAFTLQATDHKRREIQYRDGLLLALISLWPVRRRGLAALTVLRHVEFDAAGVNLLLHTEDTKSKQAESFRVPDELLPYLQRYLTRFVHDSSIATTMTAFGRHSRAVRSPHAGSTTLSALAPTPSSGKPWVCMTSAAQPPPSSPRMLRTESVLSLAYCNMPPQRWANSTTIWPGLLKRAAATRHTLREPEPYCDQSNSGMRTSHARRHLRSVLLRSSV